MQDAYRHCGALVREEDRDRFIASLFAPAAERPHLHALYAFDIELLRVRLVVHEALAGEIRLQWWRDALAGRIPEQAVAHPVAAAFIDTIRQFALPTEPIERLIDARALALYDGSLATLDALEAYARQTASTIFDLAARILDRDARVGDVAAPAGVAAILAAALQDPVHRAPPSLAPSLLVASARSALAQVRDRWHAVSPAARPAFLPLALVEPALARRERQGGLVKPTGLSAWRRQWLVWRAARRGSL